MSTSLLKEAPFSQGLLPSPCQSQGVGPILCQIDTITIEDTGKETDL